MTLNFNIFLMFDILQWNCRGLRTRAEQLKVLINEYNPSIICLQETKLGHEAYNPGLNYKIYNSPPPIGERAKGGAAIIVKKSLQHSSVILNTSLQAVAVQFVSDKQLTVCSLYLPPDLIFNNDDIQNLIDQLPVPFLLLGDFNAHNPLWGSPILDNKGKIIEDVIDANNVALYNDGTMTFHNIHQNQFSALDLSICSSNVHLDFNWSVNEFLNGSDHFPIHLKYVRNTPADSPPKWKVEEADWSKFSQGVTLDRDFESFESHLEAYSYFTESTLKSAEASIPKTRGKPRRPAVPWWNKTCGVMRKVTRKCYRRFKTSGSPQTKIIYHRALAKQRKYYKKAKRDSWLYYINGISSKTPMRTVWRKIRKLSGKFIPAPLPTLKVNDTLITDPNEVANKLGKHFSEISSSTNYSPQFQRIRDSQVVLDFKSDRYEAYNARFSLREFKDALSSTESTSPGEDTILYEMLKHLPEAAKRFLLKIINKIWETGILPEDWKISLIVPVKKPNKDASLPTSYRPIALTSCVCKLMEKMINTRLVWHLETEGLTSPLQFGFKRNRSTLDPLFRLSNQIQQGFSNKCQTIGVFFDMEKAYDSTWRFGIIKELHKKGLRGNMMRFINSFLSERSIKVRVGNSISSAFRQEEGVPQGSVLSVTCFAVAINNILEAIPAPVKGSLYVDDFALYCTGYDAVSTCRYVQKAIDSVSKWADEHGFKFSTSKTVAIRFTRLRKVEEVPTLTLKDNILPFEKEIKFLGMTFDEKLTWASHIDALKLKVKKSLNLLKVVSGFSWGADKKSLLRLYDSLCRSKLDYGCQIYSSATKTKLKELDVVHNMGLRICTGAFRTSPVESLYVDSNELPLHLRREELGLRYTTRIRSSHKNPCYKILEECDSRKFGVRSSKPFQIRQLEELDDLHIQRQKIQEVDHPKVPPWLVPEASCCPKNIIKKDHSEEEIKAQFLEHDLVHKDEEKIYTDGSKSEDGVGCAVVYDNSVYVAKLPDSASVFTAEMTAIVQALELACGSEAKQFVIYSDSKSALDSLSRFNTFHPLIQKAQEWLFSISSRYKSVRFCWVPAHVGIQGNEEADKEARIAASAEIINIKKVPHMDMKGPIRKYILRKWQERWESPLLANNKKYKAIRSDTQPWPSSFNSNRRVEVILSRLRIGHTRVTHNFILDGSSAPECAHCDRLLSVEHILVHCSRFSPQRLRYHLDGKSLREILDDDVDIGNLLDFLRDTNLLHQI